MSESLDLSTVSAIRGTTGADERTIRRFLRGERIKGEVLRARLTEAARTIGAQIQQIEGAAVAA